MVVDGFFWMRYGFIFSTGFAKPKVFSEVVYDRMDAKGIQLIRRDNCQLAKTAQQAVLDELLHNMHPQAACIRVQEILSNIVKDTFDQKYYEMSKSLRKSYKNEDLPHVHVVPSGHGNAR